MHSPELTFWRLSQNGELCLGPSCNEDGLFLGRTPLLERESNEFVVRDQHELERVISAGYGCDVALETRIGGLRAVAKSLNAGDLCRATIAAVMLRLPDLPNYAARRNLEAEDRLAKTEYAEWTKSASSFDPEKHPRWPSGQSDGGQFRPVTGESAGSGQNSSPSDEDSNVFWPNVASIVAAGAVEVVGNIGIAAEEIGSAGIATPAVPAEEVGLAAVAAEAADVAAEVAGPSSRALRRALESAGSVRQAEEAAHHIVAGAAQGAAEARAILQEVGIGINDAANGLFLQSAKHAAVHTAEYYAAVNRALAGTKVRAEAVQILQSIARRLKSGAFP